MKSYLFLDTDILIHYRTFDEIDWPAELGLDKVVLVITSTVLSELDRHKNSHKRISMRKRAGTIIKKLNSYTDTEDVRHNVSILFLTGEPMIDWVEYGLDPTINDDRILASLFVFDKPDVNNVYLVTSDLGFQLKAKSAAVNWKELSELLRMDIKTEEEVELARLRREVGELKSRIPKLVIKGYYGGELTNVVTYPIDIKAVRKQKRLVEFAGSGDVFDMRKMAAFARSVSLIPEEEYDRSEKEEKAYYEEIERIELTKLLSVPLSLAVVNEGNVRATNVKMVVTIPTSLQVYIEKGYNDITSPPEPPEKPRNRFELCNVLPVDILGTIPKIKLRRKTVDITEPKIAEHKVTYTVPTVTHHEPYHLKTIYLVFEEPGDVKSFTIDYEVFCDEVPKKLVGSIPVTVDH